MHTKQGIDVYYHVQNRVDFCIFCKFNSKSILLQKTKYQDAKTTGHQRNTKVTKKNCC